MNEPCIVAVCRSDAKGTRKQPIAEGLLVEGSGLEGDAHSGPWHRQISLLADESYERARAQWDLTVAHGDFAENLTTRGIELKTLPVGTRLRIGSEALLEVTQIGKKCHSGCEIMRLAGRCVFPEEGIFGRVLRAGTVRAGDTIEILGAVELGRVPVASSTPPSTK